MKDQYNREITYMRISITDQCNYRCAFCMPEEIIDKIKSLNKEQLSEDEILKVAKAAVELGIKEFRITGGEPLLRQDVDSLIKRMKQIPDVKVYLSTNGLLLKDKLQNFREIGLDGINISLSSLDADEYSDVTGAQKKNLDIVLENIFLGEELGLKMKVNCVPIAGKNENQIIPIAMLAKHKNIDVRFIEMMPIGMGREFIGISNNIIKEIIETEFGNGTDVKEKLGNGPATYIHLPEFKGKIGFISANSCSFCNHCNRVRMDAAGRLRLCLNDSRSYDLKEIIREEDKKKLKETIKELIYNKPKEHNFKEKISKQNSETDYYMVQVGG